MAAQQPVSGSSVQLYAAGISGVGSTAQPLLSNPVRSDSDGSFSIPASYLCPSASSQLYVVARGGSPGLPSGADNPALALTAMLGSCDSLSASIPIYINEVTTIGSVWPLAAYMKSPSEIGSATERRLPCRSVECERFRRYQPREFPWHSHAHQVFRSDIQALQSG